MNKQVAVFAHRGASGYVLENTLQSFEKALKLGAQGIELDVQRSKDQQLFVFHDADLVRLAGVRRQITDCTAEEIATFHLGKKFLRRFSNKRIPTLEEVIKWANEKNMALNIELKETLIGHMKPVVQLLKQYPLPKGSHISSFIDELLIEVKRELPTIQTAIIVTKKFNWDTLADLKHIDAVHAHKKYYKRRFLKAVEVAEKPIRFYAITGHESYLVQPHPSVAAWITDFPDKVVKIEKHRQRKH